MMKILKNKGFYIKTLLAYGVIIALMHSPSMQYEQKYDSNETVGASNQIFSKLSCLIVV